MNIFQRTAIIRIPRIRLRAGSVYDIQPATAIVWMVLISLVTLFFVAMFVRYPFDTRVVYRGGTHVITQVVHDSGLSDAQQAYISQCEKQDHQYTNDDNDINNYGIPNVEARTWTCTFAH